MERDGRQVGYDGALRRHAVAAHIHKEGERDLLEFEYGDSAHFALYLDGEGLVAGIHNHRLPHLYTVVGQHLLEAVLHGIHDQIAAVLLR